MIIDMDTHVSAESGAGSVTVEELIKEMDACGVDRAVAWPMVSYTRQVAADNGAIAQGMRAYPDRIIGFGGLNPRLGLKETLDELKRCREEYGFGGFKLNGARDEYTIDDPKLAVPVIEAIVASGAVLAFHSGLNDPVRTHPVRIGRLASRFRDATILIVHMGLGLYEEALEVTNMFANVHLIASEAAPRAILRALQAVGPTRICYGSDCPFVPMRAALAAFRALIQDRTPDEQLALLGENALGILKRGAS